MFNIGLPELLIIVLVVIVFISPKELPGFVRKLGRGVQQIRHMREQFTRSMREIQDDLGLTDSGGLGAHGDAATREEPRRTAASAAMERRTGSWDEGGGI